jgi:hypothetical protein
MKHHAPGISQRFLKLIAYDPLAGLSRPKKRRADGGRVSLAEQIVEQAKAVDTDPSEGQKIAGNYKKGHVKVHGLDISIENPRGSYRSGVADGKPWKSRLPNHYGYLRKTEGGDGQHVDVYLGPHLKSPHVFVIDQHELGSGLWDEHKCLIGFGSKTQAREAYHRAFSDGKGKDRIGHIETMTVDGFKSWLRDGDTTKPVKGHRERFAAGGAVDEPEPMAGGGAPPYEPPDAEGPPPYEPAQPDMGGMKAAWQGAKSGATFNFSDEIAGARGAAPKIPGTDRDIPEFIGPIPARTIAGAGRLGLNAITGNDHEAVAAYERARDEERAANELAQKQHPYLHGAGQIAGSLPAMAILPELGAARALAPTAGRLAKFGATVADSAALGGEYGALSGAGEGKDVGDRAMHAAEGIVSGIVGGAAAPVVGAGAGAAYDKFGKPIVGAVRGWVNPEAEAARRLATALRADQELIAQGKAQGMSSQEWTAARQAGEPVTLAELGSSNTQALLRSAANTSPEGRAMLEKVINDRFAGQSERVAEDVRGLVAGGANAHKTGDQLIAEYDRARVPAYKQAYRDGDREIISPAIERLMGSPLFEGAMKSAVTSGKDRAVMEGYGAFNPGVSVENGMIKFSNTKPNGVPVYPNLQYWDAVKKELDGVASMARRSGDPKGDVAANMSKVLRGELDQAVPSYGNARGIAAQYFGESNALEAGQKLAGKKVDPKVIRDVMAKMKPDERELFREGYASDWAGRVIGNISESRDITKAMFNSPNERARAMAVFGPGGMAKMEARMSLETIMDGARKAMGNSTTARQLIEAGLAGGAIEGYMTGDWHSAATHGIMGGLAGAGLGHSAMARGAVGQVAAGASKLIGKVNGKMAAHVAELLTSNDPTKLQQGLRMAQKNQKIADGLRDIANRMALAGQTKAIPHFNMSGWSGSIPAHGEDQQQAPRIVQ